ncbi:hypothetical protein LTS18_012366 [Coniosporium uncinatum]|uniref:Uncharacterized protein n=1 Tax=Coniosporium uncinatum TaxID=93489 RepID=A0ACC3DJ68_9PEZI|nr:hypothetical protein LTS18_012366 [Coniosporium uncinatum]
MGSPEVARMFLETWTPHYLDGRFKPFPNDRTTPVTSAGLTEIKTAMNSICNWRYESGSALPYAHLIIAWKRCGLPYRRVMDDVFKLVHKMHGSTGLLDLMQELDKAEVQLYPRPITEALKQISKSDPHLAARILKARRIWLAHMPHLAIDLIRGNAHSSTVFDLLGLRDPTNTVPTEQRVYKLNSLHNARVELVHVIAHTFAHDMHSTHRVAFRNVWLCFRYLRARHAPIHPNISKSLVWAGIIRPLRNGQWVSTVKFSWILGWVRRLEGEDSAQQLDQLVFHWRNQLLRADRSPSPCSYRNYKPREVTWHTVPRRRSGVKVRYSGKLLPCIRYHEGVKSVYASFKTLDAEHTGAVARNIGWKDWQAS